MDRQLEWVITAAEQEFSGAETTSYGWLVE
jgi:hypothetical protein